MNIAPSHYSVLTPDNFALSEVTLPDSVAQFVRAAHADNTVRAYQADLAHFMAWGGSIPANPEQVASYLAAHARSHAPATLARWLVAIAKAHKIAGHVSPTSHELVRLTLRGIRRSLPRHQVQARPVLAHELRQIVRAMGDDLHSLRDWALLLVGFAGAFRRSELVGLTVADVERTAQGILLHLRRSKTDQLAEGRAVVIPACEDAALCPVGALTAWLDRAGIANGPLFRPINRHGQITDSALSAESVAVILKSRARAAGLDPAGYSGHSLRAGFATSAILAGVATDTIRSQTGHKSPAMLSRYVRLSRSNAWAELAAVSAY